MPFAGIVCDKIFMKILMTRIGYNNAICVLLSSNSKNQDVNIKIKPNAFYGY